MPVTLEEAITIILQAQARIIELESKIKSLEELLKTSSQNSSQPPSQDKKKKTKKAKSKSKRGGQPGHEGKTRKLINVEEVDEVKPCEPVKQCECGGEVEIVTGVVRHQVIDIPEKQKFNVTEYQLKKGVCKSCGKRHQGELPDGIDWRWFGKNIQGLLSVLTTRYKISRRDGIELINSLFGLKISLGSISNYENLTSEALASHHQEIKEAINNSPVINVDETGYKEKGNNKYAWVMATFTHVYFICGNGRGSKVAKELIGEDFKGISITDRYGGYHWIDSLKRQICWAHLKRDFTRISERGGESERIGKALLESLSNVFSLWKDFKELQILPTREDFKLKMKPIMDSINSLIEKGLLCGNEKSQRTFQKIFELKDSMWTFVYHDGVEPTNNLAERAIRPLVIHRKKSFGTQSPRGSRFAERTMSVVATAMAQGADYLASIIKAIFDRKKKLRRQPAFA